MSRELKGDLQGQGIRIAIVVARFNQFVTQRLLDGAQDALRTHGVKEEDSLVAWVPGAFDLPVVAKTLAQSHRYDSIICLGAVIRGETTHYEMVANQASSGIARAALETGVPVLFGVLTTESMDQAINRAGGKSGNIGYNAATGAIEMANLMRAIKGTEAS